MRWRKISHNKPPDAKLSQRIYVLVHCPLGMHGIIISALCMGFCEQIATHGKVTKPDFFERSLKTD